MSYPPQRMHENKGCIFSNMTMPCTMKLLLQLKKQLKINPLSVKCLLAILLWTSTMDASTSTAVIPFVTWCLQETLDSDPEQIHVKKATSPLMVEDCNNGIDDDDDGFIDGSDSDCSVVPIETTCSAVEGDITFTVSGNTTTSGYTTQYLLTDRSNVILQTSNTPAFTALTAGDYIIYNLNYETTGGISGNTTGNSISDISGSCFEVSGGTAILICSAEICGNGIDDDGDGFIDGSDSDCSVVPAETSCSAIEGDITFTVSGNTTDAAYTTEYLLTDRTNTIVQVSSSASFTALMAGDYIIYSLNYETVGGISGNTAGNPISGISGSCFETSGGTAILVCGTPSYTVSPTNLTFDEGMTGTFTVVLDVQPTSDVVFTINSDDPGAASVDLTTLTFTPVNWNTPQTITVTGEQDVDLNDENVTITVAVDAVNSDDTFDALADQSVAVTVNDDDNPGYTVSPMNLTIDEGMTGTFTVVLDVQPTSDVVFTINSDDPGAASVDLTTLTFTPTNWDTPQTITVTGEQDVDLNDENVTIVVNIDDTNSDNAFTTLPSENVNVTVNDDDTASEICGNGIDDDGDGFIDGSDTDCSVVPAEASCSATEGDISFSISGNNTDAAYTTRYLLTDRTNTILQISTTASFTALVEGDYVIYSLNYRTVDGISGNTIGNSINSISSSCFEVSGGTAILICGPEICGNGIDDDGDGFIDGSDTDCSVVPVETTCSAFEGDINFTVSGNNTNATHTTQYILTDRSNMIVQVSSTPTFTALMAGDYIIYSLNYETAGGINGNTAGNPISSIDGGCFEVSGGTAILVCAANTVEISPRVFLQGAYESSTGLMHDTLRIKNLIPLTEPYTALPAFTHVGGGGEMTTAGLLAVTGNDAIVDWVFLELRDAANPAQVLATASALVQRDGDIVAADGSASVQFNQSPGNYYFAVRHRNHLGTMTADPLALTATPIAVDFTNPATALYQTEARFDGNEQATVGGVLALWQGNTNANEQTKYSGNSNDVAPILDAVISNPLNSFRLLTFSFMEYRLEDVDMNGTIRYEGNDNDVEPIFDTMLNHPLNAFNAHSFIIIEQLAK